MLILLLWASLDVQVVNGQYFSSKRDAWKRQRQSIGFGLGVANFLGELGGRDETGSDFIYDLELSQTRPALNISYRYQLGRRVFSRNQFAFGVIAGNDNLTEETFRKNRNLHFRSPVLELATILEFNILDYTRTNIYERNIKKSFLDGWALYGFIGIGITYFNPKANFNGRWYALRPLGTEGQNQPDGPAKYSPITAVIPMGLGIRYELNQEWTFGLELGHRVTFTDYMDDVSTVYYDNNIIFNTQGELAAYFADPSLGFMVENGQEVPLNSTFTGAQRGDPNDNDAYMLAFLTAQYKFVKGAKNIKRGRAIKKRRARRVLF